MSLNSFHTPLPQRAGTLGTPGPRARARAARLALTPQDGVHLAAHPWVRVRRATAPVQSALRAVLRRGTQQSPRKGSSPCGAKRLSHRTVAGAEPAADQHMQNRNWQLTLPRLPSRRHPHTWIWNAMRAAGKKQSGLAARSHYDSAIVWQFDLDAPRRLHPDRQNTCPCPPLPAPRT
jgi:hypothetical protein